MYIGRKEESWQEYILIQPAVSVGSVGQLAVDLILNNIPDIERIGYFYDKCFVPVAGSNPFQGKVANSGNICTSCEVYQSKANKFVIIQQRAPFIKGRIPSYRRQIIEWIKSCQFKQVVLLGSCSSHVRNDTDLQQPGVMYLASKIHPLSEETFSEKLKWTKFSHSRPLLGSEDGEKERFIPGGGIIKSLYEDWGLGTDAFWLSFVEKKGAVKAAMIDTDALIKMITQGSPVWWPKTATCSSNIQVIALLVFSSDGNGTEDAIKMADGMNVYLPMISNFEQIKTGSWRIPFSWSRIANAPSMQQMY